MTSIEVGQFWERKSGGLRIEILRAYAHDEFMRVVFYGEDFPTMAWLEPSDIVERYTLLGTIEDAHAEALGLDNLRDVQAAYRAPISDVHEAEERAIFALGAADTGRITTVGLTKALLDYQAIKGDYGLCLMIGCHTWTPTVHLCPACLRRTMIDAP